MSTLYDWGLQPERTYLAWRRTLLSISLGIAVAIRYLDFSAGIAALVAGCAVAAWGLALYVVRRRYILTTRRLVAAQPHTSIVGLLVALVTIGTVSLSCAGTLLVLSGRIEPWL